MCAAPAPPHRPASVDRQEVEWQFTAEDLKPIEHWLLAYPPGKVLHVASGDLRHLVDLYFDTEDWRFHRAGYGLRLRHHRSEIEVTLKSLAPATDGLQQRREVSETSENDHMEMLTGLPGPVGKCIRAVAGTQPIQKVFEIRTHRRPFTLRLAGQRIGEVALDESTILTSPQGKSTHLCRVEVEAEAAAAVAELQPFVDELRSACHLQPALQSKYAAALQALGFEPASAPDFGPTTVEATMSLGAFALAILRGQFALFLAHEPGTRLGEDPEELHQMRVASRRLRAAMSLFQSALPAQVARLRRELGWVATALGQVRDLDIQLSRLASWKAEVTPGEAAALEALAAVLSERRALAQGRLLRSLDSRRYARLVAEFGRLLRASSRQRAHNASQRLVLAAAPELIRRLYRKVRNLGDRITMDSPPADYHALRIRCKRLRYAVEFVSGIYGKPAQRFVRKVIALQTLLGLHQDAYVASANLHEMSLARGRRLPAEAIYVMGQIAERYMQQAGELRGRSPKTYRPLQGKAWKQLRRTMEALLLDEAEPNLISEGDPPR